MDEKLSQVWVKGGNMKHTIAGLVFLIGFSTWATPEMAKSAFMLDQAVKEALKNVPESYDIASEPEVMFIRESCGFVGCIAEYMVGIIVRGNGVNRASWSILGKVKILNNTQVMSVALLHAPLCDPSH